MFRQMVVLGAVLTYAMIGDASRADDSTDGQRINRPPVIIQSIPRKPLEEARFYFKIPPGRYQVIDEREDGCKIIELEIILDDPIVYIPMKGQSITHPELDIIKIPAGDYDVFVQDGICSKHKGSKHLEYPLIYCPIIEPQFVPFTFEGQKRLHNLRKGLKSGEPCFYSTMPVLVYDDGIEFYRLPERGETLEDILKEGPIASSRSASWSVESRPSE